MITNRQQPAAHPKWEAVKKSFRQSNYITDFWNWFMTLMSKAAEMVLFGTVLYSGYQLLPGVPHVPATIDAAIFVIQQGALDIGGMGLLKLAKRAGLPRESFPVRLGMSLVVLMILNVVLASIKHTLPLLPDGVFVTIETLLLIARAVVAVLFGHAIHALREEYSESTVTLKEAGALQQRIEELATELATARESMHVQFSSELAAVRESFHQELSSKLTQVRESVQQSQEMLASIPVMQAQLHHLASVPVPVEVRKHLERPVLRALPSVQPQQQQQSSHESRTRHISLHEAPTATAPFDARAFVFTCLQENPALKLAEIEQLARACKQPLSQATASRYRKQFFARDESSSMQSASPRESTTMQEDDREDASSESPTNNERRIVGE